MKDKRIILILTCILINCMSHYAFSQSTSKMHLFHSGLLSEVYISKTLYTCKESNHLYIKFRIVNRSEKKIGVDLSDYWEVIFPNQWIIHPIERQIEAVEYQEEPPSFELRKERMKRYLFNNKIPVIEPGEYLEYYRDYDSGKAKNIDLRKGEVLNISFDGVLFITDGEYFELVQCFDESKVYRNMYLMHPLKWDKVPADALIIRQEDESQ